MTSSPCAPFPDDGVPLASVMTVAVLRYRLHAVSCDVPVLVIPLSGTKGLYADGGSWKCLPGQFLMMHFAMQVDVENIPAEDAPYRATVVAFPWEVVAMARELLKAETPVRCSEERVSVGGLCAISDAVQAYVADADSREPALCHYRLLGILLALYRIGHGQFLRAQDPSLSARIRLAVSGAPAREWKSCDFEEMFCLSGATLRRRLAEEGVSLRTLIQEARLHAALQQLQNTRKPVKAVARESGYRSVASFRRSFIDRFQIDPARVANPAD